MIADSVLELVTTTSMANEVLAQLEGLNNALQQTSEDWDEYMKNEMSESLAEILRGVFTEITEPAERVRVISALEESIQRMPVVTLTLSFRPRERFLERVTVWFREVLGRMVLIEARYDTYVLGGAVVAYEGKHADVSLRSMFDEKLEAYKQAIVQQLST